MMRRIATILGAIGVLLASHTAAATTRDDFSMPIRLPGNTGWRIAENDRGETVAVQGSSAGAVIVELAPSGAPGRSWLMRVPRHVGGVFSPSVALSKNGNIAVAVRYFDGQREPAYVEEHEAGPCCAHVAVASWKLGEAPPLAQAVSPHLSATNESGGQPGSPRIVIGRAEHVTALWARGVADGEARGEVEDAFGQVGGSLHTQRLVTASKGVQIEDLHVAPNGRAVASWLGYAKGLQTVSERAGGGFRRPARFQRVPRFEEAIGFSHDSDGNTIFSYLTGESYEPSKLDMMVSHDGDPFRGPRVIASLPKDTEVQSVYVGSTGSLLAVWRHKRRGNVEPYFVRWGSLSGRFGRVMEVGRLRFPTVSVLSGLVETPRRSLIIYQAPVAHHPNTFELDALSARPGRPFGHRVQITPALQDCRMEEEFYEQPIVSSPSGRAFLYVICEHDGVATSQDIIRYTPRDSHA